VKIIFPTEVARIMVYGELYWRQYWYRRLLLAPLAQDQEIPKARVAAGIVDLKSTKFNRFGIFRGPFTNPVTMVVSTTLGFG
jgi:hypothetical protein